MNALMIHVERAVRPLRASKLRKLRMREEMLGHLKGIYEEERERLGDHDAAVRGAIKRFGPAEELSQKLQTSVPWHDSMMRLLAPFLPNQGWQASVLSLTFWSWALCLIGNALALCLVVWLIPRPRNGPEMFEMLLDCAMSILVLFGALFAMAGAFHGVLLHPKSIRWAIIYGAGLFSCILIGGVLLYPETPHVFIAAYALMWIAVFAMASWGIGMLMRKEEVRFARLREWEQLELS